MQIGGIQPFSLVDYPGKMSCVVFCQGCCMRCSYCHNKQLQPFVQSFEDIFAFLEKRVGLLEAVVFSGGEPLLQHDLYDVMLEIKNNFQFLIGLHTAGVAPDMFKAVLPLVDWVGLDVKTDFSHYENVTHYANSGDYANECFNVLVQSGKEFEVRTTYDARLITDDDMIAIADLLQRNEIKIWHIQECILRNYAESVHIPLPCDELLAKLEKRVNVDIRRG